MHDCSCKTFSKQIITVSPSSTACLVDSYCDSNSFCQESNYDCRCTCGLPASLC